MTTPISFTGNGQEQSNLSILGSIGASALNVGLSAGAGAAVGGAVGKVASMIPIKPSEAALNHQYEDMFIKAAKTAQDVPEYLKDKGDEILGIVKNGQQALSGYTSSNVQAEKIKNFTAGIASLTDDAIKNDETQNIIKEFFKDATAPTGGYAKESVVQRLTDWHKNVVAKIESTGDALDNAGKEFVEKAKNIKGLNEMAEQGAKHLRKSTIIGAGVGIGVLAALTLNLLNTYGLIGGGKSNNNQNQPIPQNFNIKA